MKVGLKFQILFIIMMIPFQCEVCHFWNIMLSDPISSWSNGMEMLGLMRQANLDFFWSCKMLTVKSNLREAVRMEKMTSRLGMPCVTPAMGP